MGTRPVHAGPGRSWSAPAVRRALLDHYRRHRRDLPWRRTRDPYRIWISEVMLQQTRVETVRERYGEFLGRFPSVADLARASEEEVCEAWAGLGYYRRARNLHAAARKVMEGGGHLPRTAQQLRALPGIGRYTAGAIASIAFGERTPVVDGNVARVLTRLGAIEGAVESPAVQRRLWSDAAALADTDDAGDLNQALMELGALVCTPQHPRCGDCPLRSHCVAAREGTPSRYPTPAPKAPVSQLRIAFGWIETRAGLWLARRPLDGLWAGLWELPSAEGPRARAALARRFATTLGRPAAVVEHRLTHRLVRASIYRMDPKELHRRRDLRPHPDPLAAPLSALARKAIQALSSDPRA